MAGIKGKGGQKGRSGRKSKAAEFGLAALLDRIWTMADREKVIQALSKNASEGNERAAALLLAYAYGKPHETIEATITHKEYEVEIGGSSAIHADESAQFVN